MEASRPSSTGWHRAGVQGGPLSLLFYPLAHLYAYWFSTSLVLASNSWSGAIMHSAYFSITGMASSPYKSVSCFIQVMDTSHGFAHVCLIHCLPDLTQHQLITCSHWIVPFYCIVYTTCTWLSVNWMQRRLAVEFTSGSSLVSMKDNMILSQMTMFEGKNPPCISNILVISTNSIPYCIYFPLCNRANLSPAF